MENYLKGCQRFSTRRQIVSQQFSWGFWAFHVLVWTADTLSFYCWMERNSCHLHRIDGEISGLADYWNYHDNREIFSSKNDIVVFSFISLFFDTEVVYLRVQLPPRVWMWCMRYPFPGICTGGATLTKQTCRGRRVTGRPHVNSILCLQEKPNRLH